MRWVSQKIFKIKKLAKNKNIILLLCAPLGKSCYTTFLHYVVGIPMMDDKVHFITLSDMRLRAEVELHPVSLFTSDPPQFVSTSNEDCEYLTSLTTGAKKNICNYKVLPPAISQVF